MKLESTAGTLAAALSAAELALDDKSNIEALKMVRLTVKNDRVEFTVGALDRRVTVSVPVTVIETGEALARCVSLTGVLAKLRSDQTVRLVRNEDNVIITAGRSRFKIPGLSLDLLPQSTAPTDAAVEFSLATKDLLHLIEGTAYATSTEEICYYVNGIFLHIGGNAETLRSAATDGHRFAQIDLPLPPGAGNMPGVIVPNKTVAIVVKLLRRKDVAASVNLRVSGRLFELSLPDLQLTSKLIDGTFPDYVRIIPPASGSTVTVNTDDLRQALARIEALFDQKMKHGMRTVGLSWSNGALHLSMTNTDETADVIEDVTITGDGRFAARISYLTDTLEAFASKKITLDTNGPANPAIRVTDPDNAAVFSLVMPIRTGKFQ